MPYYVRMMRKEDVPQVNEIDREAFPTQWPPPNYRHELENQFARYIVACDEGRRIEGPATRPKNALQRLAAGIARWFDRKVGNEPPQPGSPYIVGFAGIWVMADESHLTNIAVRLRYQRHGVGELLLISAIDLSAKMKAQMLTLEVRVSNDPAQTLYRKYGFIQVGLRRGYYTDNREDAMLMSTGNINSSAYQEQFQRLKQAHTRRWGAARVQLNTEAQPGRK